MMLDEKEVIARTAYGEARGEGRDGLAGVIHTIKNRVCWPGRKAWGSTFRDVCLKPGQFDCWSPKDPNYKLLLELSAEDPELVAIRELVDRCLDGRYPDPTAGATFYYNPLVVVPAPWWARATKPSAVIRHHTFHKVPPFRDQLTGVAP
jgi:N-acetylmuramoyl-L-alanine amidase